MAASAAWAQRPNPCQNVDCYTNGQIIEEVKKAGLQVIENVDPNPFMEITKPVRQTFVTKFGGENYIKAIDEVREIK